MKKRRTISSLLLTLFLLLIPVNSSWAVFNEKDLAQTLQVLRYELAKAYAEMSKSQLAYEKQDERQHEELIRLVNNCNELSLMLYSQKQDFTFDLTYALQQVTDQYLGFRQKRMPYDNIIAYFDVEIDRYDRLIRALQNLPPETVESTDSLSTPSLVDLLAMTFHIKVLPNMSYAMEHDDDPDHAGHDHGHGHGEEHEHEHEHEHELDFQLDSLAAADRDSCVFYASKMLKMFTDIRDHMVEDNEHYTTTDSRLREAYDYAQERYKLVQKKIFVDGQRNYWYVLTHLRQSVRRAVSDCRDKYGRSYLDDVVKSEWRGPIVLGFSFIILIYLALASLIGLVSIKSLKRKVGAFKTEGFANREFAFNILLSLIVFVILIVVARFIPRIATNFFLMASSLLVEFCFLMIAILVSLLIRCTGVQIDNGLRIYTPVLLMGLLIIAFRIIFIPNSLINLVFPPLLLCFGIWQLAAYRNNCSKVPKVDKHLAVASLVVTVVTLILSCFGYVLMGLQIYIWWIFQLTVLQLIMAVKNLVGKYRRKRVDKLVRAYRINHIAEVVGNDKGSYILVTWFYDFLEMVFVPLLVVLSIPLCIFLASRVFDLTQICLKAIMSPFLDTKVLSLSLYKLLLAVGLYYIFRFIEYLASSLYRIFKIRSTISKSGTGLLRENEVNLTLYNNVIWLIVWGIYVIAIIGLLKIPTKSLSVVTAGLAAGLGFAMKDILNNFFYGVQLMSGRLRVGDTIECDGIRGTVENISYQTTTIKAVEGSQIAFPNSTLFSKTFKNLTKSDSYEFIPLDVGVAYGTDVDQARRVILKALRPLCKPDKFGRQVIKPSYGIQIVLDGFGDSSLNLKVKQYVLVEQRYVFLSKANELIYKALADNGIEIPFPQRDVHIKNAPSSE
ncbi:MAG: mechanosensitive ion channel [Bacteroidales bacterium]|nr:mechanosensitive ion channel [Bacteroidales bacterium]